MTRRINIWVALLCAMCVSCACVAESGPVHWKLAAKETNAAAGSGPQVTALVTASIESGWHLYALDQGQGGPVPTSITIPPDQIFELAGEIQQPQPLMKFDTNFNLPVRYFEGNVTFTVPLRVKAKPTGSLTAVKVRVAYQICNDQTCLPPTSLDLTAPVGRSSPHGDIAHSKHAHS